MGSSLGAKASPSVVALASSSKHIIQIVQLLEERRMSFSFCLNKNELLLLSGFGLLFQGLDLDRKGKLIQDSQRLMCSVMEILERNDAPGAAEFKRVACAMICVERSPKNTRTLEDNPVSRRKSDTGMPAPKVSLKAARKQLRAVASRFTSGSARHAKHEDALSRRATAPSLSTSNVTIYARSNSQNSISSAVSDPVPQHGHSRRLSNTKAPRQIAPLETPNLDFLSFNNEQNPTPNFLSPLSGNPIKESDHDRPSVHGIPPQPQHSYESLFPFPELLSTYVAQSPSSGTYDWASDLWAMPTDLSTYPASSHSVLSFSEEELTSGEELSSCDVGRGYRGIVMPHVEEVGQPEGSEAKLIEI